MNTELALERHRKVVLGLDFAFTLSTARFIAGCCWIWISDVLLFGHEGYARRA